MALTTLRSPGAAADTFDVVEPSTSNSELRRHVFELLAATHSPKDQIERRNAKRFPYAQLFYLTTVAEDGVSAGSETIVVVGRTLSEGGVGFFHREPLPYRRMIASLEGRDHALVGFLLDLRWCRFTAHGWYESGAKFLQIVPSPVGQQKDP